MGALLAEKKLYEHLDQPLLLGDRDLRNFDKEAAALVLAFQLAGWRGHLTAKGHAFMRAPDGQTTASVSRDSLRGRSGRNSAAALKAWMREHPLSIQDEIKQRHSKTRSTAFGKIPTTKGDQAFTERVLDHRDRPMPIAAQVEMRKHPLTPWLLEASIDPRVEVFLTVDNEDGHRWAFGDIAGGRYDVMGFGTGFPTADAAREFIFEYDASCRARHQDYLYDDYLAHQGPLTQEADVKVYQCDQCEQRFETELAHRLHRARAHGGGACPECGKEFVGKQGLAAHRSGMHGVHSPRYKPKPDRKQGGFCEICGKELTTPQAMSTHLRAHKNKGETAANFIRQIKPSPAPAPAEMSGDVTPDVTPDTSPAPVSQPGADVLADHLLTVPQGADAEDLIAKVRAIVAAPLVAEVRRLRVERDELAAKVELMVKEKSETEAKMELLRETLGL